MGVESLSAGMARGEPDSPDALGYTRSAQPAASDSGWELFGGYRMSRKWALEASFRDLGETDSGLGLDPTDFAVDARRVHPLSTRSMTLGGSGFVPLSNGFAVFGKVGLFGWNAHSGPHADPTLSGLSSDDSGTGLTYGIGGKYDLGEHFSLSAGWERLSIDRDSTDFFSAGVRYRFE